MFPRAKLHNGKFTAVSIEQALPLLIIPLWRDAALEPELLIFCSKRGFNEYNLTVVDLTTSFPDSVQDSKICGVKGPPNWQDADPQKIPAGGGERQAAQ